MVRLKNILLLVALLIPKITSAGIIDDPTGDPMKKAEDIEALIRNVQNMAFGIAGAVAVAMMIWGGITLITSGGNEEKTGKGKKIMTYSVGGLLLIIFSYALIVILIRFLGGDVQ